MHVINNAIDSINYLFFCFSSISFNISIRTWCLPPSYSPDSHASTIIFASSIPTTLAPKANMFVLLCCLDKSALYGSLQVTQRIPLTLLAARESPTPVPQITIPLSTSPLTTAFATASPDTG